MISTVISFADELFLTQLMESSVKKEVYWYSIFKYIVIGEFVKFCKHSFHLFYFIFYIYIPSISR